MQGPHALKGEYCQEYSMKYIYSTSQISKLSLTLCTFSVTGSVAVLFLTVGEVGFLEDVIGLDGVKIEKEKVQEVVNWLVPKDTKDMQKFLGLANYYRQFVKDFTRVEKPLYEIMRKDVKQNWRERQQKVFEELKERFIIELVLVTPDLNKEMRVEVDMLDFAMSGVLLIKCENKK